MGKSDMSFEAATGMKVAGHVLPADIVSSLKEASRTTGVDFNFLVAQASVESGFQGNVRSRRSSAAGLFQFTSQTWMHMMQQYGARYGYADTAKQIKPAAGGHLGTGAAASDNRILDLRKDVKLSAILAGELAKENSAHLQKALGGKIGAADLHLAHLLGAGGAVRFLKARQADGAQAAAAVLPAAARQNPTLFFDRADQSPRSVAAVYRNIKNTIETPLRQVATATGMPTRTLIGTGAPPTGQIGAPVTAQIGTPEQVASAAEGDGSRPDSGPAEAVPPRLDEGA
jgi:hypothetical protein